MYFKSFPNCFSQPPTALCLSGQGWGTLGPNVCLEQHTFWKWQQHTTCLWEGVSESGRTQLEDLHIPYVTVFASVSKWQWVPGRARGYAVRVLWDHITHSD